MIDLTQIENYRENNRLEAKRATGGLPESIWETYSAFANTLGGIILLGVEEYRDKSLHVVNLPFPEDLIEEFWDLIRDPHRVSRNILALSDVTIEEIHGKRIVAIRVPPAPACDRPVYIGGDPLTGSYYRNGEGDYRLPCEEIRAMQKNAANPAQ